MTEVKNPKNKIPTIADIEQQVWDVEGVRVVIRLPAHVASPLWNGQGYTYKRALNRTDARLAHLHDRLSKGVFGQPVSFVAIDGKGGAYHINDGKGHTRALISRIRATYNKG